MLARRYLLIVITASIWLSSVNCGKPQHSADEKYYLIATNIKLPYWQSALAGLNRGATQMNVKAELRGPDTYDTKAEHDEFQAVLRLKPTGILVSPGDPNLVKSDIDAA